MDQTNPPPEGKKTNEKPKSPNTNSTPRSKTRIDYQTLDYASSIDHNLLCPICRTPLLDPVKLPCDHTFCRDCLARTFHNQAAGSKSCPSCRGVARMEDIAPLPRLIGHMLDDLTVKCVNWREGCEERMRRGDLRHHVEYYCDYADLECPDEVCGLLVPRREWGRGCRHHAVQCLSCKASMMEIELDDHLRSRCTVAMDACPYCRQDFTKAILSLHVDFCAHADIACSASAIGCKFRDRRGTINEHTAQCPLVAIHPTVKRMEERVSAQHTEISGLRLENEFCKASLEGMRNAIDRDLSVPQTNADSVSDLTASLTTNALSQDFENPPFDSSTHHLLSVQETLREELDRVASSVTELDARTSVHFMNENLRLKEDMSRMNGLLGAMRVQLQWLISARLQAQSRGPGGGPGAVARAPASDDNVATSSGSRRPSDSFRQETKL